MDELAGKFKAYDSGRRKDAADEHRLAEVNAKLIYSAERKLKPTLSAIVGAKIESTKIDNLEVTEDADSGAMLYNGKVVASISFFEGKVQKVANLPIAIVNSQPVLVAEDIKDALAVATLVTATPETIATTTVTASLSDFKVVDDGTRYLKIYHTAAYGDLEAIGAISKEEYVTADRKALLSEMFKDEAVSWPADVSFTGEFAEPEIVAAAMPANVHYVVKADATVSAVAENEEANEWAYKTTDASRLSKEAEAKHFNDIKERLAQRATVIFPQLWRNFNNGIAKVKKATAEYDLASRTGKIDLEAEILDGKEAKLLPFSATINGTDMKFPDLTTLASLLKEAKVIDRTIYGENLAANINLNKTASVEKKATPMAPTKQNYQEVLRMPKDFLPASLKIGDVIEVDGLRYKLASKSEGQLSNERNTASHWLFERVHGEDKPIYRQQAY